jgi:hypothetical protein
MNKARGVNTSIRNSRMSAHQTVRTGSFTRGVLQKRTLTYSNQKTGTKTTLNGVSLKPIKATTVYRAPKNMPRKLNNTAAAAISSKRFKATGVILGSPFRGVAPKSGGAFFAAGRQIGGKTNNYASVRLRASGFKVAGTGYGGVIKPASGKEIAKGKKRLDARQAKDAAKIAQGPKVIKVPLARNGSLSLTSTKTGRGVTLASKNLNKGAASTGNSASKAKGGSGQKTGRKNFRPRRDGNGKFAGSY